MQEELMNSAMNTSMGGMNSSSQGMSVAGNQRETHQLIGSDKVEGTAVRRTNGDRIGTIDRVMIDKKSGKVAYAVMSFGGFLGLGEDYYTLPWHVLTYNTDLDAYEVNLTEDQLRNSPRPSGSNQYDRGWEENVHRYYNTTPYWGM
jgi:PRC-barrel domain